MATPPHNITVKIKAWIVLLPSLCLDFTIDETSTPHHALQKKSHNESSEAVSGLFPVLLRLFQKDHTSSHSTCSHFNRPSPPASAASVCYSKLLCNRWSNLEAAIHSAPRDRNPITADQTQSRAITLSSGILFRERKMLIANLILKYHFKRRSIILEISPKKYKSTVCPWYSKLLVISFQLDFSEK